MLDDLFGLVPRGTPPAAGPLSARERAALARHLPPGEVIEAYARGRDADHGEPVLWAAAGAGLLLVGRRPGGSAEARWLAYGEVDAVEATPADDDDRRTAALTLVAGGETFRAAAVPGPLAERFADLVFDRLHGVHAARRGVDARARATAGGRVVGYIDTEGGHPTRERPVRIRGNATPGGGRSAGGDGDPGSGPPAACAPAGGRAGGFATAAGSSPQSSEAAALLRDLAILRARGALDAAEYAAAAGRASSGAAFGGGWAAARWGAPSGAHPESTSGP